LGSGTASVDTQDAWGVFRNPDEMNGPSASKNRFAFTGYVFDRETELYFAKARFYDPTVGRFTSQDSFLGEIDAPPSLHRYFYANANPTRFTDPDDHAPARRTPKPTSAMRDGRTAGIGSRAAPKRQCDASTKSSGPKTRSAGPREWIDSVGVPAMCSGTSIDLPRTATTLPVR
jgi:RHS repeat-associated protein